jgi:hypothetical protein
MTTILYLCKAIESGCITNPSRRRAKTNANVHVH